MDARRTGVGELPVAQQILLEYHYWHDLDADALGSLFGLPSGTIGERLTRARQALRRQLEQAGPGASIGDADDKLLSSLITSEEEDAKLTSAAPESPG